MSKQYQISSVTKLAKQLAGKEIKNDGVSSQEMLNALGAVAKMLEAKAVGDHEIMSLAKQVQAMVTAKVSK